MSADFDLWTSMPVPVVRIDAGDRITDLNPAAEGFLNASMRGVQDQPVWDVIAIDAPIEEAFQRARTNGTPLFVNDVFVGSGHRAPMQCALQISTCIGAPGDMLLMITPRELSGRMTQNHSVKSSAQSAIGMAEMLAHEIKNPAGRDYRGPRNS